MNNVSKIKVNSTESSILNEEIMKLSTDVEMESEKQWGYLITASGEIQTIQYNWFYIGHYLLRKGYRYIIHQCYSSGGPQTIGAIYSNRISDENRKTILQKNIQDDLLHTYDYEYYCDSDNEILAVTMYDLTMHDGANLNLQAFIWVKAIKTNGISSEDSQLELINDNLYYYTQVLKEDSLILHSYIDHASHTIKPFTHFYIKTYNIKKNLKYVINIDYCSGGVLDIAAIYTGSVSDENFKKSLKYNVQDTGSVIIRTYAFSYICESDNEVLAITLYYDSGNLPKNVSNCFVKLDNSEDEEDSNQIYIPELCKRTGISSNNVWSMMETVNQKVNLIYGQHFVPTILCANNRYSYGNVHITADFTVPNIGSNVTINIDSNPSYTFGYNGAQYLFFIQGENICIGTKDIYDVYKIISINNLQLECRLLECNTNLIGSVFKVYTEYINESDTSFVVKDYAQVFREDAIIAYQNNILCKTFTKDLVHPSPENYVLIGKTLAERINLLFGQPTRIIAFGDSWTIGSNGFSLGTLLNCTLVNKGKSSDRVEHIINRFTNYIDNEYVEQTGDVFVFVMGTNNLGQARNAYNDKNIEMYNKSYVSIFMDACGTIAEKLPAGNFIISQGFITTYFELD